MKNDYSPHWEVIKTIGLKGKDHDMEKLAFINEKIGFFLGSEWIFDDVKNKTIASNQDAIINKSIDGGKNWKVDTLGKGKFFHFQKLSNHTICAVKKVYSGLGMGKLEYIEGFNSGNEGESWKTSFKTNIDFISLMFLDSLTGIGISKIDGIINRKLYVTKDGGKTWTELKNTSGYIYNNTIEIKNSKFYLLGSNQNKNYNYNLLFEIDTQNDKVDINQIAIGAVNHIYIDSSERLWLTQDGNKAIKIYLKKGTDYEQFKKIESENEIFLEEIYSYNDVVNIVLSETIAQVNRYSFLRSGNLGKTWTSEELPLKMMVKPSCYYGENYVWMYAGGDRFQVRK